MTSATLRTAAALGGGLALLALGACRSNPCAPRATCAQPPAPAPCAPAPCAPHVVMRSPAPMGQMGHQTGPMGQAGPMAAEQVRIQQETIARQREALEAERSTREATEARLRAAEEALVLAKSAPAGEDAAAKLEEELRRTVVTGATVLREGSRVVVVITDAFQSGSDRLKPGTDVQAAILATGAAIARHPEAQVAVLGHSDGTPLQKTAAKWGDNVGLSRARAETVAKALEGGAGVSRQRMAVDGRGSAEPLVAPETSAADRAKNRRVEVQFSY